MSEQEEEEELETGYTVRKPQFTLYSHEIGPNGWKVAQILSELGLKYNTVYLEFGNGVDGMKTPEYQQLNPNGRIPALVDHGNNNLVVWESGAIILYLVKKYDPEFKLWAETLEEQALIETWLFYQISGQAPYLGQAMWFIHYHPEHVPSAETRYREETRRILAVLEKQLSRENCNGWLVLGRITVADLSFLHWYLHAYRIGVCIESEFPKVWRWMQRMKARPAIKAVNVGARFPGLT